MEAASTDLVNRLVAADAALKQTTTGIPQ
jgi:hypothetical protein